MEVFTFLRMGGSKERIDTLPLKLSSTALARQFAVFDARHSQCFAPEDKERLLGIIESSSATTQRLTYLCAPCCKADT